MNKERILEDKIFTLEQRLALVERFVELRFCETFRDFTIRNARPGSDNTGGGTNSNSPPTNNNNKDEFERKKDSEHENPEPRRSSWGRPLKASAKANTAFRGSGRLGRGATLRKCVVRVERTSDADVAKMKTGVASTPSRYETRGKTMAKELSPVVKQEVEESVEEVGVSLQTCDGSQLNRTVEDQQTSADGPRDDGDAGSDYFTFPVDGGGVESDSHNRHGDVELQNAAEMEEDNSVEVDSDTENDEDWRGSESEEEKYIPTKKRRVNRTPQPTSSSASKRGRPRKRDPLDGKKRQHVYYLASISDLSQNSKIVSTDTTREECPICKQYWKRECLQQHIASHTRERHLKCDHCDKRYFSVDDLRIHVKISHDRDKHYPRCRICNEPIVRKMILHEKFCIKRAIQNGEGVEERLLEDIRQQCAQAGLEFSLPDETVPPGCDPAEKMECPTCKRFIQRRYFDRHVKMHSLERNWKCGKCPKAYIHKHDLIRHMCITHEISLKCDLCDKVFETRMLLHNHKLKCRKSKGLTAMPRIPKVNGGNRARKANQLSYTQEENLLEENLLEENLLEENRLEEKMVQEQEKEYPSPSEAIPMTVEGDIFVEGTDIVIETTEEVVATSAPEEMGLQ